MYGRKSLITFALTILAASMLPGTSSAQLFGRGRGYGGGYYGGGYGGGYGPGYYGNGLSVGVGRGYGYGYPNGGYGYGSPYGTYNWGSGYGGMYQNYGYPSTYSSSPSYYSSSYSPSQSVVYGQPSTNVGSTYQSFYPPQTVGYSGCGCSCVGGSATGPSTMAMNGRGTVVVNVPANATVTWNGSQSAAYGPVRYYTTLPLNNDGSTTQKFEARWTGSDGNTVTKTREIQARPNETVTIDFNSDTGNGVSATPTSNSNSSTTPNGAAPSNLGERKDNP